MKIVTMITDFGTKDPYVGMMKGSINSINPEIKCVDITHEIECGDIKKAAFFLLETYQYFPEGTVNLVVVDPTVGSERKAIIVEYSGQFFVGPDNGVFTPFEGRYYDIERKGESARTFDGRDVFAPVAAELASGKKPEEMGVRFESPVRMELYDPEIKDDVIEGSIIHIDRFGNLISNIKEENINSRKILVEVGGQVIKGLNYSYCEGREGEPLVLINGGFGTLEVGVYKDSAAELLNVKEGEKIRLRRSNE